MPLIERYFVSYRHNELFLKNFDGPQNLFLFPVPDFYFLMISFAGEKKFELKIDHSFAKNCSMDKCCVS